MKKYSVFMVLMLGLLACSKNDPIVKDVVSVSPVTDISVSFGTDFSAISFPSQVTVTYSDNSTQDVNVTFTQGTYDNSIANTYILEGDLALANGTTNKGNIKASVKIIVNKLKLASISEDGILHFEYFYDEQDRLKSYKIYNTVNNVVSVIEYTYSYDSNNKVTQRIKKTNVGEGPEKYFYHTDGTLDRIEIGSQTHTYTYQNGRISRMDNSDQSINGLKFRTYTYDADGNVSKVGFDFGNNWQYTYLTNKKILTPLVLDPADPLNQMANPIATFLFVQYSSYNSVYTYNTAGYPIQEVQTFPLYPTRPNVTITYKYQ
jgi:hypothetical protein